MTDQQMQDIKAVIATHPEIKLAYLFGSQATGDTGPMSDYDFAIYTDEPVRLKRSHVQTKLMTDLMAVLKTDAIDVVVLNDLDMPELAFAIVCEGIVLHEEEPYRLMVEPTIMNAYFDFKEILKRYDPHHYTP